MTRKPDFFIVGAAKSGTTSLYAYLRQHPEVFLSVPKEPHFFGHYGTRRSRIPTLQKYLALFADAAPAAKAGEASTSYLYSDTAARQIVQLNRQAKILILLRNPVDRTYSQYCHKRRRGQEPLSFEAALDAEAARAAKGWGTSFFYVRWSMYAEQVRRYVDLFGSSSVRVYLLDDLQQDAFAVCRDIFAFLDVDTQCSIDVSGVFNRGGASKNGLSKYAYLFATLPPIKTCIQEFIPWAVQQRLRQCVESVDTKGTVEPILPSTRERLRNTFRGDVEKLQDLLDRDLSHWLRGQGASVKPSAQAGAQLAGARS